MSLRVVPTNSPPLSVVAPFFLAAPVALLVAGLGIAMVGSESLIAVNSRHNVAITHAIVLGWLTLTMMGALYQLGPAVLGSATRSTRLARAQFAIHAAGLAIFVPSLWRWNLPGMATGGSLVFLSALLFLANTVHIGHWRASAIPALYVRTAQVGLFVTVAIGITFVGNHEHGWFAITPGRLAAHAHLGMIGWIGLTLMGISYQLVPMFNVVRAAKPRYARPALLLAAAGLLLFGTVMTFDPSRAIRLAVAVPLTGAFALWAADQARLLHARSRRKFDIQGEAAAVSLGFLALTAILAMGTAWGMPFGSDNDPARWPVAYGLTATLGWAGVAIIGNTHKILPFLVWYHRYRTHMGEVSVPLMTDLYSERLASVTLAVHSAATLVLAGSAILGELSFLRAGGVLLALSAVMQMASLARVLMPRTITRHSRHAPEGVRP